MRNAESKWGLALGGGARGIAHVGILKALELEPAPEKIKAPMVC